MPAPTWNELLQQALSLPDDSKLLLAEELVASVTPALQADDAVVDRRRAEFLAGAAKLIPVEDAIQRIREELSAQRDA